MRCLPSSDVRIYFRRCGPTGVHLRFAVKNTSENIFAAMHMLPVICVNCAAPSDRGTLSHFQFSECLKVSACSSVNGSSSLELHIDRWIKPILFYFHSSDKEPYGSVLLTFAASQSQHYAFYGCTLYSAWAWYLLWVSSKEAVMSTLIAVHLNAFKLNAISILFLTEKWCTVSEKVLWCMLIWLQHGKIRAFTQWHQWSENSSSHYYGE